MLEINTPEKQSLLLFISYYFPPIHVNAVVRIKNFYEGFIENGFQIYVITGKFPRQTPRDTSHQKCIPNISFIPLVGIRMFLINRILKYHTLPLSWKRKPLVSYLLSVRNRIPFDMFFGDGGLLYFIRTYLQGLRWIKKHKITHIFSSFSPITDHFVAYLLKCRYPYLHWIADFRDLPLDIKSPVKWNHTISQFIFKKMMCNVNEIITVSEGLKKKLVCFNPHINIYSGCISSVKKNLLTKRPSLFNLNYTGSIYPDSQDLYPLIIVLKELIEEKKMDINDIKWTYCGIHSGIFKEWLAPYFNEEQMEIQPLLSLNDSKKRQKEAGINILLTWSTDNQEGILTTKLFEYLESGRPILVWTKGKSEPEMRKILACYQKDGYYQKGIEREMKCWISKKYSQWKRHSWKSFDLLKLQKMYSKKCRNALIKKVSEKTPTRKNT